MYILDICQFHHFCIREDFKKKNGKENDIVQKGGEVSEKKSNFECIIKSDILLGKGAWLKPYRMLLTQKIKSPETEYWL